MTDHIEIYPLHSAEPTDLVRTDIEEGTDLDELESGMLAWLAADDPDADGIDDIDLDAYDPFRPFWMDDDDPDAEWI